MFSSGSPRSTSRSRQASAAAPAPDDTSLTDLMSLPTTFRPLGIAAAEHRGAVRDDADEVAARGETRGVHRVFDDFLARERDARRVRQREVALVDHLLGRGDRQLPGGGELVVIECGFAEFAIDGIR